MILIQRAAKAEARSIISQTRLLAYMDMDQIQEILGFVSMMKNIQQFHLGICVLSLYSVYITPIVESITIQPKEKKYIRL